jgi:thiol:disulfide interchange protein
MNKIFSFIFFFTLPVFMLQAQVLNPIHWSFSHERTGKDEIDLIFTAKIDKNWHLYSQDLPDGGPIPTSFTFAGSDAFELSGEVREITKPEIKYDPSFDLELRMFSNEAEFRQKINILSGQPFSLTGSIEYMCCDDSRCLPPTEEEFSFTLDGLTESVGQSGQGQPITTAQKTLDIGVEEEPVEDIATELLQSPEEGYSLWLFFLIAFLAGLGAILTPCVYPMIPMTITFFMRGSENRFKAVIKGLVFGISIVLIYTLLGVVVALTSVGADFANQISTHWIPNTIFFLLFMIFAASFLGMFELILPGNWVNNADKRADRGGYAGAFFMALTLVLVSFSCTGPMVGAILVESAGGLALKPVLGMFGFSFAFALPFTLLSISPSWMNKLPKSGAWMNSVKVVLGFIVLAFGFKFLSTIDQTYHMNILSREVYLSLWIVIFTLMGLYLLGKLKLPHDSPLPYISVPRLALAIITFTFVVYLIPGLFGAPLTGISALIPPKTSQSFDLSQTTPSPAPGDQVPGLNNAGDCGPAKYSGFLHLPYGLKGYFDYEEGMACAGKLGKPVFIDFTGHACSNCKEMEAKVWPDPRVLKRLKEDYVIISLYIDDKTKLPEDEWVTSDFDGKVKKTLGKKNMDFQITRFNTNTQPYYVLAGHDGQPLVQPIGHELDVDKFVEFLDEGLRNFNK